MTSFLLFGTQRADRVHRADATMNRSQTRNGWIDGDAVAIEHLTAIKRAGANVTLTYFARWFAEQNR